MVENLLWKTARKKLFSYKYLLDIFDSTKKKYKTTATFSLEKNFAYSAKIRVSAHIVYKRWRSLTYNIHMYTTHLVQCARGLSRGVRGRGVTTCVREYV